jgi:hypothetical protein
MAPKALTMTGDIWRLVAFLFPWLKIRPFDYQPQIHYKPNVHMPTGLGHSLAKSGRLRHTFNLPQVPVLPVPRISDTLEFGVTI